jgi:hypothetical protein
MVGTEADLTSVASGDIEPYPYTFLYSYLMPHHLSRQLDPFHGLFH